MHGDGYKPGRCVRSNTRRLRVAETVSLGEKRFVAVVQVDGRHFLLAGGPTNIALLAQLDTKDAFEDVLKKTLTAPRKQAAKRKRPASFAMQAQVNRTNSVEDAPQKAATARIKQPAKRVSKQNAFGQRPASAPPVTRPNGTENFGDVLQKTMSAGRQPGNHLRKQNSKSTTEQMRVLRVRNVVIPRAILCIVLCLGATSAEAWHGRDVQPPERALA